MTDDRENIQNIKNEIFYGPMRNLILTMSAWRRLLNKANEMEAQRSTIGAILLYYMSEARTEAEKDLKKTEKKIMKEIREGRE